MIASGVRPSAGRATAAALRSRPAAWNPTISYPGSVAAVTSAIAAEATRGVSPGTPATRPPLIEPDTSSASSSRLPVGSTFPNAA